LVTTIEVSELWAKNMYLVGDVRPEVGDAGADNYRIIGNPVQPTEPPEGVYGGDGVYSNSR